MVEPVSIALAKKHLDVTRTDQDELFEVYILAARESVERHTGLILAEREVTETFREFDHALPLRAWPVAHGAAVTVVCDGPDGEVTVDDARVVARARPAQVLPKAGTTFPWIAGPVTVTVTAGEWPGGVPQALVQAILLLVGSMYEHRSTIAVGVSINEMPTALNLCHPYRLPVIG